MLFHLRAHIQYVETGMSNHVAALRAEFRDERTPSAPKMDLYGYISIQLQRNLNKSDRLVVRIS